MKKFNWLFVLIIIVGSCKKEANNLTLDYGYDYFPIDSGYTWLYKVDSIAYDDNTQRADTFHFYLMEKAVELVKDQNLNLHRIVERYVRTHDSDIWQNRSNKYVLKTSATLQVVEENTRTVKLIFPLTLGQNWNGNMYNNNGGKPFELNSLGNNLIIGDTLFKNTATVIEMKSNNAIEEILVKSVYAKGIGLVSFTNTNINTQLNIKSGFSVTQQLISFSKQ